MSDVVTPKAGALLYQTTRLGGLNAQCLVVLLSLHRLFGSEQEPSGNCSVADRLLFLLSRMSSRRRRISCQAGRGRCRQRRSRTAPRTPGLPITVTACGNLYWRFLSYRLCCPWHFNPSHLCAREEGRGGKKKKPRQVLPSRRDVHGEWTWKSLGIMWEKRDFTQVQR